MEYRINQRPSISRRTRVACAILVFALVGAITGLNHDRAGAEAGSASTTAANDAALWLASTFTSDGWIAGPGGDPAVGKTVTAALALATAGVSGDVFTDAVTWIEDHVNDYVEVGGSDSPGSLGYLLLLADVAGSDPTNFGGHNLITRLNATLDAREPGLFGAADPTYDGIFRQSLAILGLEAAGVTPPATAVSWLKDQQCDSPVEAKGGWQAYRADTSVPCSLPDPMMYSGPDSNSTALAVQALAYLSVAPPLDPVITDAMSFFAGAQDANGGFGYIAGGSTDPNSTALVIQAIYAAGGNPSDSAWIAPDGDPISSLLSWQIGCDGPAGDRGAFTSPFSDGAPDSIATIQAIWGASGHAFPLGFVEFRAAQSSCDLLQVPDPDTTNTTASGSNNSTTVPVPTTTVVPTTTRPSVAANQVASPARYQPAFAG